MGAAGKSWVQKGAATMVREAKKANTVYVAAKRAARRERGLCWECASPAVEGRARCRVHLSRHAADSAERKARVL